MEPLGLAFEQDYSAVYEPLPVSSSAVEADFAADGAPPPPESIQVGDSDTNRKGPFLDLQQSTAPL